jgi:hypothetical protein
MIARIGRREERMRKGFANNSLSQEEEAVT